jgi:RNA polymerase sigma-70 factor (ECF subfamily)
MEVTQQNANQQLSNAGSQELEQLFKTHFAGLYAYAYTILRDSHLAEEIVQEVFVRLYERAQHIRIKTSLESYLYRAVYNESLNHQKHEKAKANYRKFILHRQDPASPRQDAGNYLELEAKLQLALEELPEQCRIIFQLSRFEELKYREIAERMGLSIKTVENQMGKALRIMRKRLKGFIMIGILLLLMNH